MRLIGMLDSPYVRRVAIALHWFGLPFAHEPLSVFGDYDAFAAISPVVKAPTLVTDDGVVLIESSLILAHLERSADPARRLEPADLAAHARNQHLVGLGLAACDKAVQIVYERRLRPAEKQHEPWVERVTGQLAAACRLIDAAAGERDGWLLDDRPMQADVAAAVAWRFVAEMLPGTIDPATHPAFAALAARAEALPEFVVAPFG